MLTIDPKDHPVAMVHQFLLGAVGPRPICFASTLDALGRPNLAPFSFFNVFSANPPILVFAPNNSGRDGTPKHTWLNIHDVPEVVINIVNYSMVQQMNVSAAPWDRGVSEFEKAGFTPITSELVKPFRVAESPVQLECKVIDTKVLGEGGGAGNLVIAEVIRMHIDESVVNEEGKIDPRKMDLVARMGGAWYCHATPESMFQLSQPMQKVIGYDGLPEKVRNSSILSANDIGKMASLQELPHEELIAGTKALHSETDPEHAAVKLISEGKIPEALGLFL
jgi:flavin reductase (DIM6/NTAB) family NADH-FMN oxidoreductase RutF